MGSSLFWFENWTGLRALYFITPQDFFNDETIHNVSDVVQEGQWDENLTRQILPDEFGNHILDNCKAPVKQDVMDIPYWTLESSEILV